MANSSAHAYSTVYGTYLEVSQPLRPLQLGQPARFGLGRGRLQRPGLGQAERRDRLADRRDLGHVGPRAAVRHLVCCAR
eukprot:SAG22_NODE_7007_length_786_cov_0.940320_1_plen_78_part_10